MQSTICFVYFWEEEHDLTFNVENYCQLCHPQPQQEVLDDFQIAFDVKRCIVNMVLDTSQGF